MYHFLYSGTAHYTEVYGTSTGVVSSQNPSTTGQSVTYTATVTASATSSQDPVPSSPTGTVTFKDSGTTICNAPVADHFDGDHHGHGPLHGDLRHHRRAARTDHGLLREHRRELHRLGLKRLDDPGGQRIDGRDLDRPHLLARPLGLGPTRYPQRHGHQVLGRWDPDRHGHLPSGQPDRHGGRHREAQHERPGQRPPPARSRRGRTTSTPSTGRHPLLGLHLAGAGPDGHWPAERVRRRRYRNFFFGNPGFAFINGTNGNDFIYVFGGSYWVNGYGGNDCIDAGDGNNVLFDGNGNDGVSAGNGSNNCDPEATA